MQKYMFVAKYTSEGVSGLLKEGGSGRESAITDAVEGLGGSVESFYFAFGDSDVYTIIDLPATTDALALSLAVGASGKATVTTTPLVSVTDIDEAARKTLAYRSPGAA